MQAKITKIGNWNKFMLLAANLTMELHTARLTSLRRWALKAEAVAKDHISSQDLANSYWAPLAIYTIQKKLARGYPLDTLIETSTYLQSITSWVGDNETAYAGVRRGKVYTRGSSKGELLENIAKLHEFGSIGGKRPARPLWQPTMQDTMRWHLANNMPGTIFIQNIRKKYGINFS